MAKRPTKKRGDVGKDQPIYRRLTSHGWSVIKRNPFTSIAAMVAIIVGIPGVVSATAFLRSVAEPIWPATHGWVMEWGIPIIKTQNTQALSIDRFLLFQQQMAVSKAKEDPAITTSPNAQELVRQLEDQVSDTKSRICKATQAKSDCK